MLMTLASSFMTATRMDGFAHAGAASRPGPRRTARTLAARTLAARSLAARALAGLRRLAG